MHVTEPLSLLKQCFPALLLLAAGSYALAGWSHFAWLGSIRLPLSVGSPNAAEASERREDKVSLPCHSSCQNAILLRSRV